MPTGAEKTESADAARESSVSGGKSATPDAGRPDAGRSSLELTFAGDLMAHDINSAMADYGLIYRDTEALLKSDDLSFVNLETPVADALPLSTYPRFNAHSPYLKAALAAGFDALSLANNHSNDQGVDGIQGTLAALAACGYPVRYSGLREKKDDAMEPAVFEKNGWRVAFLSVTEIFNAYDKASAYVYYVAPTEESRARFLAEIAKFRNAVRCDAFVLSIHLSETEYGRTVSDAKKAWFTRLAASGVDVVWGHHPHVMQSWETVTVERDGVNRPALFMYSMGNFISGQRREPAYETPTAYREYTGDGVLLRVRLTRGDSGISGILTEPQMVTNYVDPAAGIVVRKFDRGFLDSLDSNLRPYYAKRYELMCNYLPVFPKNP